MNICDEKGSKRSTAQFSMEMNSLLLREDRVRFSSFQHIYVCVYIRTYVHMCAYLIFQSILCSNFIDTEHKCCLP